MARIFLIGPMGSGKSTVGKSLARKLQFDFYDSDREIEARCGVDIPTIFEFEGETGFRKRERKVIGELATIDNAVIATGGGSILNRSNRKVLRDSGHVILLSVDLEEQIRRVALNRNRPLLQVGDVEAKLKSLMDERRSLYESTAHHIVSTNSSRMQNVVAKILRHLIREEIVDATRTSRTSTQQPAQKTGRKSASATTDSVRRTPAKGTQRSSRKKDTAKKKHP